MIEINLLPEEHRKKDRLRLPELPVQKTVIIAFVFFFGAQILLGVYAFQQKNRIGTAEDEIARLTVETKDIARQKKEIIALKARLKEIEGLTTRRFHWSRLLNAVSDSLTKGAWLRGFHIVESSQQSTAPLKPGQKAPSVIYKKIHSLSLDGSVVGQGQETAYIGKFIKELKDNVYLSELFADIKLSNINQKKIREFDVYDFVLMAVFKEGMI